jgi:hypothetical protein
MKVLVTEVTDPIKPENILTFSYEAGAVFERIVTGEVFKGKGIIAEVGNASLAPLANRGAQREEFLEPGDFKSDLKFIDKVCANYKDGTEVEGEAKGGSYALHPDESGRIGGGDLAEGDLIAVGPAVSPKALMNAHGLIVSVNGTKCAVEFDEGDLDRVNRATGKHFKNPVKMPKSALEKVA